MQDSNDIKNRILEGTIAAFNQKGMKFTMDDLAKILGMSKKTIYTVFRDKDELFLNMVDYLFDSIKKSEEEVLADDSLSTIDKIRKILGVLPDSYRDVDFRQLFILKDKYPDIYAQVERRLETGWDTTIALINQGIEEGVVRPVRIPILKMMMEASLEQFFQRDVIAYNGYTYTEALNEVVDILVSGIEI